MRTDHPDRLSHAKEHRGISVRADNGGSRTVVRETFAMSAARQTCVRPEYLSTAVCTRMPAHAAARPGLSARSASRPDPREGLLSGQMGPVVGPGDLVRDVRADWSSRRHRCPGGPCLLGGHLETWQPFSNSTTWLCWLRQVSVVVSRSRLRGCAARSVPGPGCRCCPGRLPGPTRDRTRPVPPVKRSAQRPQARALRCTPVRGFLCREHRWGWSSTLNLLVVLTRRSYE